ncbi:hypothetical protein OZ411_29690 [Bradyrhizobium sp. Arg237L]|uniref:hypothetical protein n=1 Tax=Bradyrhizobium sp. Arg237L TaxID=3003352 RepID=UPI00249F9242|nr:hypothetical protein [Bradyrhizobium sp. Arg237L]MDI4236990.1 hypothetical protein [Bradyrhizobium sp. Arg237L]
MSPAPALHDTSRPVFQREYYIVTLSDDCRSVWRWEIKRRGAPMGVRVTGDGYSSQRAAEEAGKHALAEFLLAVASEQKRG